MTAIFQETHVLLFARMREARPSAMRIELRIRFEELRTARPADVCAVVAHFEQFAGERTLGAGLSQDVKAFRTELVAPIFFAFDNLRFAIMFHLILWNAATAAADSRPNERTV